MLALADQQILLTDPDCRSMATSWRGSGVAGNNVQVAVETEHHLIIAQEVTHSGSDRAQLANMAVQAKDVLGRRCANAERQSSHPFGTLKMRMGATYFLMKRLPKKVGTEMALCVLAYNLTRVMTFWGIEPLIAAIRA
jgi:hypothetical protein